MEPSTITVGETSTMTVRLLDERDKPVVPEVDIPVIFSTNLGHVPSSMIISPETNLVVTEFTSEVPGIAVISVKSKGLIGDTTGIAVLSSPTPTPSPTHTPTSTQSPMPKPAIPGFEAVFAIVGLLAIAYLLRRSG